MDVQEQLRRLGRRCACIRCREIRGHAFDHDGLRPDMLTYAAGGAEELFLSLVTQADRLAAYVRLSLPGEDAPDPGLADLEGAARVRELHVYGQSLPVGEPSNGEAQHVGLGARLMGRAEELARAKGFRRIAVIAALGTRDYYRRLGYRLGESYMVKEL
jgi:elongator complex protein 3